MLWLSWPKGGRLGSNLGLPKVIKIGYDFGLVESTCLRVSDVWAGLKFTHPAHRAQCVGVELPFSHFSPFEAAPGHPRTGRVSTSAVGR